MPVLWGLIWVWLSPKQLEKPSETAAARFRLILIVVANAVPMGSAKYHTVAGRRLRYDLRSTKFLEGVPLTLDHCPVEL